MPREKRPRDPSVAAFYAVGRLVGELKPPEDKRDPAAVELGRKGGAKGGRARAAKMTADQRRASAKRAAAARWGRRK